MRFFLPYLLIVLLLMSTVEADPKPVTKGPVGKKVFDDLSEYYKSQKQPEFLQAIKNLKAKDLQIRASAGDYLLALFKQSFADEISGRSPLRESPFWGGGSTCDARELRIEMVKSFAKEAQGEHSLACALWLLEEEKLAQNQSAGIEVLLRVKVPQSVQMFKKLLVQPHPNNKITEKIIEEVGKRKLQQLVPDILRLCNHYRSSVRKISRQVAVQLELKNIPEYKAKNAFTPWLGQELKKIAAMVKTPIPLHSKWVRVEITYPGAYRKKEIHGWLIGEDSSHYFFVTWFGEDEGVSKKYAKLFPSELANSAKLLIDTRLDDSIDSVDSMEIFSKEGSLTGQFEPQFISVPEVLAAAWSYERGDSETAAALLFPRMDAMEDDRWLTWAIRDMLGHTYHQQMLYYFSYSRNYSQVLAFARHLSKPLFDDYEYQQRAQKLIRQLQKRDEDFKSFSLPTPLQWEKLKKQLGRKEQIQYLAERLRLLNCRQRMQPGGVNYNAQQYAGSFNDRIHNSQKVINPYTKLREMKITVKELPVLVPFLADENFMPTFSYWRNFHPGRTLHKVNWAVAFVVYSIAKRDLADLPTYYSLDKDGKKRHLAKIIEWCKANANKNQRDLLVDVLTSTDSWGEFEDAAHELYTKDKLVLLPLLVDGMKRGACSKKGGRKNLWNFDAK